MSTDRLAAAIAVPNRRARRAQTAAPRTAVNRRGAQTSENQHRECSTPAFAPPDPLTAALATTLAPVIRQAVEDALAEHDGGRAPEPVLLTGAQLDAALQISPATRHRLRAAGMPVIYVLDSPRHSLPQVLAWLEERSAERAGRDVEVGHA